jgi:2-haloalkanoic acid dehalogenase type II
VTRPRFEIRAENGRFPYPRSIPKPGQQGDRSSSFRIIPDTRSFQIVSKRNLGLNRNLEFEFVTFDCYGTLIDWETGVQRAFKQALEGMGLSQTQEAGLFELYQEEEKRIEGQMPYRKYREVLGLAASAAARGFGKNIPEKLPSILAEQLPSWAPFPDTNPALEKLATEYTLGILSNVDDDLLGGTLKHFTVPFDLVVTAERVRSYKPGTEHFEEARRIIGADRGWLHVAASVYHDIEPALRLGVKTVWVNRKNSRDGRRLKGKILREVRDLAQLANWLAP